MVRLTEAEFNEGIEYARLRHTEALKAGKKDKDDFDGDPQTTHLKGVLGEMAAAKERGVVYEHRYNQFKSGKPDLGEKTEVRCGRYIIRRTDNPDRNCMFMRPSKCMDFRLAFERAIEEWRDIEYDAVGWVPIREIMSSDKYLGRPNPYRKARVWEVPVDVMRPMDKIGEL